LFRSTAEREEGTYIIFNNSDAAVLMLGVKNILGKDKNAKLMQ
jgi:hypothetical protein